jgi:hypothetical protein
MPVEERCLPEYLYVTSQTCQYIFYGTAHFECDNEERGTYYSGKRTSEAPHIQTVVIVLVIHKELRALEKARGDAAVVIHIGMIELSKTPINEAKLNTANDQRQSSCTRVR